nr:uncharacterized protein LOC123772473 [Procambarus clarkii]
MVLDWTEPSHHLNTMASHLQYSEDQWVSGEWELEPSTPTPSQAPPPLTVPPLTATGTADVNAAVVKLGYTTLSGGYGYAGLETRDDWPGVSDALVTYTTAAPSPLPPPQHFYTQNDGVMTELGGVNGHAGTPVGGYPPSSVAQATPTGSLPPTSHHPHTAHRPVDLSQAQRDTQPYTLHDPLSQRATLLDTGE